MKSFGKALVVGLSACVFFPVACGDSDENPPDSGAGGAEDGGSASVAGSDAVGGTPGSGGAALLPGVSTEEQTIECGSASCTSVKIAIGGYFVDPCCPQGVDDVCGVETSFLGVVGASFEESCQAVDQVGELDEECPSTASTTVEVMVGGQPLMVPIDGFAGCCRAETGTCGVVVDTVEGPIQLASFGLGCVDAAPFFPGETPAACGAGSGGSGSGGAGSAGEPSSGGAGGAPSGGGVGGQ